MFMVTTDAGVRVHEGKGGLSDAEAEASAKDRNERATETGLQTRYVVVPFVPAPKE